MRKIKTVSIGLVYNGEYSALKNTCFVNELDTDLTFKGDIAQRVINNNGENIQYECKELTKNSHLSVGSVFITHNPHPIIHAVVCSEGEVSDFLDLCDATRNSLLLAETNCIKSVTFPAIGAYIGRVDIKDAIFTILEHIQYVLYNASFDYLEEINFFAQNKREEELFKKYLSEIFQW